MLVKVHLNVRFCFMNKLTLELKDILEKGKEWFLKTGCVFDNIQSDSKLAHAIHLEALSWKKKKYY